MVDGFHDMFTRKILFNFPVWSRLGQFHRQRRRKAKVERARWRTLRKRHPSEASRIVGKILVKWERLNEIRNFRELQELIQSAVLVQYFYEPEWSEIGSVGLVAHIETPKGWTRSEAEFLLHTPGVHSSLSPHSHHGKGESFPSQGHPPESSNPSEKMPGFGISPAVFASPGSSSLTDSNPMVYGSLGFRILILGVLVTFQLGMLLSITMDGEHMGVATLLGC